MKALSFKQPWAWLVAAGIKDVENRTWWLHMPPFLNYPANPRRIYVHASKSRDNTAWDFISARVSDTIWQKVFYGYLGYGAIIGEVDIVACISNIRGNYLGDIPAMKSPWFTGPYGLVLKNAVLYEHPIPCKGKLGFFEPIIPLT